MSDSDDDYMSETILSGIQDVRPGIAKSYAQRRALGICARSESAAECIKAMPKKIDLEKIRRDEALATPVGEGTKGFSLLAKMGYKPGMVLGKPKEGSQILTQPLDLNFKTGRTGIGHETQAKEEQKDRVEAHLNQMKEIVAKQEELLVDYRKRKRATIDVKQVSGDLRKMRKACQELDVQIGLDIPCVSWYWPIYKDRTGEIHEESLSTRFPHPRCQQMVEEEETAKFVYANGKEAPSEFKIDDLDDDELAEMLNGLVKYLREKHFYCFWCGANFESKEELTEHCPGNTRELHDE